MTMYRPPENSNRVKSIKSKFEQIENENPNIVKNGFGRDLVSRQTSDPARRNIKRTPAFRIDDKNNFQRNASHNRSYYFDKIQQKNVEKKQTTSVENATKPVLIKSKSSHDFAYIRSKFDVVKVAETTQKNCNVATLYTEPVPKALRVKKTDNTNSAGVLDKPSSNSGDGLTDTLKAALRKPLPRGPAPQKPPRTFEHAAIDLSKNVSFLHSKSKEEKKAATCGKNDPRYMLSKLEMALRNNKFKLKKPVKSETTTSGEDSDDSLLFKSKTQRQLPSIPRPSTDLSSSFNFNCLQGLTSCKPTYETIKESNSAFFVSCQNEEPVYAEPFNYSRDTGIDATGLESRTDSINLKNLYYMSTPLLDDEKNVINTDYGVNRSNMGETQSNLKETLTRQVSTEISSQSSSTTDSSSSTPLDEKSFVATLKIRDIIDTFEMKKKLESSKANNQRIEDLKTCIRQTIDTCFDDNDNNDNDKLSVDQIIDKFQTYVKTMPKYQTPVVNPDDRLFYCCLVVGWTTNRPQIKFRYPAEATIPDRIEDLCFPDVAGGPLDISNNAQCYTLVITNDKGERTFGYCRRVIPEGSTRCIPLAYCILSRHRAPRFYKKILAQLESRHGIPEKHRDELIGEFYNNKFPRPGEKIKINLTNESGGEDELILTFHQDTRYEEADLKPLHSLKPQVLLKIFASLLLERKVIFISCVMSKLSSCVDALQSILYPFSWPHTFIPILPQCLWDVVESPTPVICGILSVSVVNNHKIEHGIVVDLDEGNILSQEGDEDSILSDSMKKAWNQGMTLANTVPPQDYAHSVYLSDAYIKVFIISLKHYKNHIMGNSFDKEGFIRCGKTRGIRRFLKWFTETSLFATFIDSVINNPDSFSLFDKRIKMYGSDESDSIVTKLLEWKK